MMFLKAEMLQDSMIFGVTERFRLMLIKDRCKFSYLMPLFETTCK